MSLARTILLIVSGLCLAPLAAEAQQAIYVVRHAEQIREGEDPGLTEVGRERARALADFLRDGGITAVYSSQAQRTRQTAQPVAEALGTDVRQVPRENTAELIARIRREEPQGRVLVVGHSETVPRILTALGHPEGVTIERSDYDNIFLVVPNGGSAPTVLRQRFAAPNSGIFKAALPEQNAKTPNISTEDLKRVLGDGRTLVLDTRPYREFALSHILGALNVAPKPGMTMAQYTSDVAEIERLTKGDKARPLVLYCNGPFCGKSKRVAEDLVAVGFQNVRRYQLGTPVWRALGNPMVVEAEGARHVFENDKTAYLIDARAPEQFRTGSIPGAKNIWAGQYDAAKDDGRLPMEDHNTRIIVFGSDAAQARTVAEELAQKASFHNVSYFEGSFEALQTALK